MRRRLAEIGAMTDPRGRPMDRLRTEIKKAVIEDNVEKILGRGLEGVDRYGAPLQPVKPDYQFSNRRGGIGPPLAPRGLDSRVITKFAVSWLFDGSAWRMVAGWKGVVSKKGVHFLIYHLTGSPSTNLPKRDIGGITPQGWARIVAIHKRFIASRGKS